MTAAQKTPATAWSDRLAFELSANDRTAQALVAGLTEEQLNWQPTTGSWSVGQCLEHLCRTNEAYLKAISVALNDKPDSPVEQITPGWIERWFIRSFANPLPNGRRASAPRKIRPAARVDLVVLDQFLSSNKSCRELIFQTRDKDINRVRFWNPFVSGIRFRVGTGLEIVTGHERRHLQQAERVRRSMNFPA